MSGQDYLAYPSSTPSSKISKPTRGGSKLKRQDRRDDIQYNKYKFSQKETDDNNVDNQYDMEVGNSDDVITIPITNMVLETHHSKSNEGTTPKQESLRDELCLRSLHSDQSEGEMEDREGKLQKNSINKPRDQIMEYNNQSEDYAKDGNYDNYGCNRNEFEGGDNGTGDFRNEFAEEYCQDEGIAFPNSTIPNRIDGTSRKIGEKLAKYKTAHNQKTSMNTIGEALTYFKSGDHSESLLRSPNLIIPSSNVKTYVLNKS